MSIQKLVVVLGTNASGKSDLGIRHETGRVLPSKRMSEVTQILREIRGGNQQGAEQLLSLVYTELKRIAAQKMAGEAPGIHSAHGLGP